MSSKLVLSTLAAFCGFITANPAGAQVWKLSGAPYGLYWSSIASSAEGSKLVATASFTGESGQPQPAGIYVSSDFGATWAKTTAPSNIWSCVACSADGNRIVAGETGGSHQPPNSAGNLYISSNFGATWTVSAAPAQRYSSVASSADGSVLVAAATADATGDNYGRMCISTNFGETWRLSWYGNCISVACSADGRKIYAGPKGYGLVSYLICSIDFGKVWMSISDMAPWQAIACSGDGSTVIAAYSRQGSIYKSSNSGASWTECQPGIYVYWRKNWDAVACSADGTTFMATEHDSGVWTSIDSGATWKSTENLIGLGTISSSVAVSSTGLHLVAAAYDAGPTWQGIWTGINAPSLTIARQSSLAGEVALLSWPAHFGAKLQQTATLPASDWTDVTNTLNIVGQNAQVLAPPSTIKRFYRLQCP